MGREVRRVPLDFDAPLRKTWQGFIRPDDLHLPECTDCHGRGSTSAYDWLVAISTLLMMCAEDAVQDQPRGRDLHPYLAYLMNRPDHRPSADAADLARGLSGDDPDPIFGYTLTDSWRAAKAIIAVAGLPEDWGNCARCAGDGTTPTAEQRAAHDAWGPTDPPEGDGWQLWETVSEGSPISPVFPTAEALAEWMTRNDCTVNGPVATYEAALKFVHAGWAPSFMSSPETGFVDGVTYVGRESGGAR